jgi:YafQ family addiction module toxin component
MNSYEIKPNLRKILNRISKKDKTTYEQVLKKIEEIINSPSKEHYKNLKHGMKVFKRVHIRGSFVLIFKIDEDNKQISFEDLQHHDKIYQR